MDKNDIINTISEYQGGRRLHLTIISHCKIQLASKQIDTW